MKPSLVVWFRSVEADQLILAGCVGRSTTIGSPPKVIRIQVSIAMQLLSKFSLIPVACLLFRGLAIASWGTYGAEALGCMLVFRSSYPCSRVRISADAGNRIDLVAKEESDRGDRVLS